MKLKFRSIDHTGAGTVGLIADDAEDMWHAYNIIAIGDTVQSSTVRKVQTESDTGTVQSTRMRMDLTIRVETMDVDTEGQQLHLKGRNLHENAHVKLGAYHTLDLVVHQKFAITKAHWDFVALERIAAACGGADSADLAAVVMQDGLAHVCLIKQTMTTVRAKIEKPVPRKRKGGTEQHTKGMHGFYEAVLQAIERCVDFAVVKCVLLASPGFVKDQFFAYMRDQSERAEHSALAAHLQRFVLVHSTSGYTNALPEIMQDARVMERIGDTLAANEVRVLARFYATLQKDSARAVYGYEHVLKASRAGAIKTLLISDSLFRSHDIAERNKYISLVEAIRKEHIKDHIFSSQHQSGQQLSMLTGVAAILRYPMPELENDEQNDDSDDDLVVGAVVPV